MNETQALARFIARSSWSDVPPRTRHEAQRALLNWLGCALGGCRDETVERALAALEPFSGARTATLIGRRERVDPLSAAAVNAIASNILDYDDTHMKTVIHPTVPVAAAALALTQHRPVTGARLLHAFVLGVEAECRIGNAITPGHYEAGWHITATCGVFGAAVAAGTLLGLDEHQMTWALGIAATQASGLTEMLGSMCKSHNMGQAARSGLVAALLAQRNFTSSARALEAPRGFTQVLATDANLERIVEGLGETWELSWNAYKPYPCGIVLHAAIDGCLELRQEHALTSRDVVRVEITMHPLALQLAGKSAPITGLQGKLSVYHAAAIALLRGRAGVPEFTDACVCDPEAVALRQRIAAVADEMLDKAAAIVRVVHRDGRTLERSVPHATGSLEHPMTDSALETKFRSLAQSACSDCGASDLIELTWSLDRLNDASKLVSAAGCGV